MARNFVKTARWLLNDGTMTDAEKLENLKAALSRIDAK